MAKKWAKLGRTVSHRVLMLRTMTTQLIKYERIETTLTKAKALKPMAENMIRLAKKNTIKSRSQIDGWVTEKEAFNKLFNVLLPRYQDRPGGYTRILRYRIRNQFQTKRVPYYTEIDAAPMVLIEFVDREGELRPARPVRRKESATGENDQNESNTEQVSDARNE